MAFSVEKYLARIGVQNIPAANGNSLALLQEAHLSSVPYENCEIYFEHRTPSLESADLYAKIVEENRGGYCFELNGAFAILLQSLGFTFTQTFARWCFGETMPIPMRRHRILLVETGKHTWIADVGIGSPCPLTPLLLETDTVQERNGLHFRIVKDPDHGYIVQKKTEEGFLNYFSFWRVPCFAQDFLYVNHYCATVQDFFFRRSLMVNLPAREGRRSIFDKTGEDGVVRRVFQIECPDGEIIREELSLDCDGRLREILAEHFGIRLSKTDEPSGETAVL